MIALRKMALYSFVLCTTAFMRGMNSPTGSGNDALTRRKASDQKKETNFNDDIAISIDDPKNKRPLSMTSSTGKRKTTGINAPGDRGSKHNIPPLNLTGTVPGYSGCKTPVKSCEELANEVKKIKTSLNSSRDSSPSQHIQGRDVLPGDSPVGAISGSQPLSSTVVHKRMIASFLPRAVNQDPAAPLLIDDKPEFYTEDQVWDVLKIFNPLLYEFGFNRNMNLDDLIQYAETFGIQPNSVLYDFGARHGVDLEELALYAQAVNVHDIAPETIIEWVQKVGLERKARTWFQRLLDRCFGDPDQKQQDYLLKKYKKIKENDPEFYQHLVLEAIKAASTQLDGKEDRSTIADTHTSLQDKHIQDQEESIRQKILGLAVTIVGWAATAAWGAYTQATSSPDNSMCAVCNTTNGTL